MSASSTQQPGEKKEAVKDVEPTKPSIKPKPTVPPKPKQGFNSDTKDPLSSPNSGGPCSPTIDIPSAFKISQLTGPQPYGARRTSLRRWSSSVGEEMPLESNTLLSPVENVIPELYTKVTTQPIAAPVKNLQTGSVWKGKSPFMLTTRGWGEQKCQGKDIHESESVPQKYSFNSASKDTDLSEQDLEENAVLKSSSPSSTIPTADHEEVYRNVQDLKQIFTRAPEEVKKTSFEDTSSMKLKKLETPAQDSEINRLQGTSSMLSVSPKAYNYFGITKQSAQYEHNKQDTQTEDVSYKSGQETTECPKDVDGASMQGKNTSLSPKDNKVPQLICPVPTPMPRANIFVTKNTERIEESPSADTSNATVQEVYRYHEFKGNNMPELRTVIREEQDADLGYLQTSPSQVPVVNQSTEQGILGTFEHDEKNVICSMTQITDKPVTENKTYANIPNKESTAPMVHNVLYTDEHYDLHEGKTQLPSDNNNKPYQDKKIVAPTDMQSPVSILRSNEIYSEGQVKTSTQIHDYNIEEEQDQQHEHDDTILDQPRNRQYEYDDTLQDQSRNRQHEYDDTIQDQSRNRQHEYYDTIQDQSRNRQDEYDDIIQTGEYVHYQTSDVPEKETEYSLEYRSVFGNNERPSYYFEAPSAPELPGPADNKLADLYEGSQMLENHRLIQGEVNYHPVNESKEPSHIMKRDTQPSKPHEELNQLQSYESSSPELKYDESQLAYSETTSQHPAARITQLDKLSDLYEQSNRLMYYTDQSPILNECGIHSDKIEYKADEPNMHHYTHDQSQEQECSYAHKVDLDDKKPDEPVNTYEKFPNYNYQELENSVHKYEQSDKSSVMYEQLEETVQRSEPSEEPVYKYQQSNKSRVMYEQLEDSYETSEPSEEPVYPYEQSDKSRIMYKQLEDSDETSESSKEPVYTDEQSQKPVTYQHPEGSELKHEQTEKSDYINKKLEDSIYKYELLEQPSYGNEKSEEPVHKNDQSEDSIQPAGRYEQSEPSDQIYQQNISSSKYNPPEESEHRFAFLKEKVHKYEHLEDPDHKYKQLDELSEHEQTEQPIQGYLNSKELTDKYKISEEPVYRYKHSEEIIHDQSQEPDYRYVQHDEPIHCDEVVNQCECLEDPTYIHTGSDAKNSQSRLIDLESLKHQYKPVQSEEMDSSLIMSATSQDVDVKCSGKDIRPSEYFEQQLTDSYTEKTKYSDSSTDEMHNSEKTLEEQVHKLPRDQQLQGADEETQLFHAESEENQHVDGLREGSKQESPVFITIKTDEPKPEETQGEEAKDTYQILNGHAEHGDLHTVDGTSDVAEEIHAEEPEETKAEGPSAETFDFLEGTVVLDSSLIRGKASLGKKRGHRIPAGTNAPEEKDPEYWMFRDSTEPKTIPDRQSDEDEKDEKDERDEASPDNSLSPVKSPNRKRIFAGIISPSLLKGRLKMRSKTTEDGTVRPEMEESKSPGKEKPESPSHSLNWLQALKKKKKSTKEEKQKQPK